MVSTWIWLLGSVARCTRREARYVREAAAYQEPSIDEDVLDTRRRAPRLRPPSEQRTHGRGLHLVEASASRWGVAERPFGKVVWAVVPW
ncbi:hypothetical protein ACIRPN_29820 [Streptomyces sp. NPDC101230]|uniref:hypothetical protein n=1 Tax=unclassified Streptomyces TaxID=2593676 RepID=UPI0037F3B7C6